MGFLVRILGAYRFVAVKGEKPMSLNVLKLRILSWQEASIRL